MLTIKVPKRRKGLHNPTLSSVIICTGVQLIYFSAIGRFTMRVQILICLTAILIFGCSSDPVSPGMSDDSSIAGGDFQTTAGREISYHDPHKLWAAGKLYFDADHETVQLVPFRFAGIHLNVLKFFEEMCNDCVLITGATNNDDGTINLSIEITHPFPNHPELTVFDPKLILMFQGSHELPRCGDDPAGFPKYPLFPQTYHLSWRLMGDPEILNPDGFTYRWSPWYDSGYPNPIFNYWEGKYAFGGTPTANFNGYLDYYSNEDRHMLESGASVERSFHLSLPSGTIVAGYALDACWEPPTVMPVLNPADDFPITANQPECYKFEWVLNNGVVITEKTCCNEVLPPTVEEGYVEFYLWYKLPEAIPDGIWTGCWNEEFIISCGGTLTYAGDSPDPDHIRCTPGHYFQFEPNGIYQTLAVEHHAHIGLFELAKYPSFDVFEVEIDIN